MSLVIPDSIEPYIGYKALRITPGGLLTSPQQIHFIWPAGERVEAECGRGDYRWIKREGAMPSFPTVDEQIQMHSYQISSSGAATSKSPFAEVIIRPPRPEGDVPEGFHWSWEWFTHPAGWDTCSCGIYVVKDCRATFTYCGIDTVVCEIALWGNVTLGNKGARGQYAYPQKMYVPQHLSDVAPMVAETYGIETAEQDFKTGKEPRRVQKGLDQLKEVDSREEMFLRQRHDAKMASIGFSCISIPFYLVSLVIFLRSSVQWTAIFPFMFAVFATAIAIAALVDSRKKFNSKEN